MNLTCLFLNDQFLLLNILIYGNGFFHWNKNKLALTYNLHTVRHTRYISATELETFILCLASQYLVTYLPGYSCNWESSFIATCSSAVFPCRLFLARGADSEARNNSNKSAISVGNLTNICWSLTQETCFSQVLEGADYYFRRKSDFQWILAIRNLSGLRWTQPSCSI